MDTVTISPKYGYLAFRQCLLIFNSIGSAKAQQTMISVR